MNFERQWNLGIFHPLPFKHFFDSNVSWSWTSFFPTNILLATLPSLGINIMHPFLVHQTQSSWMDEMVFCVFSKFCFINVLPCVRRNANKLPLLSVAPIFIFMPSSGPFLDNLLGKLLSLWWAKSQINNLYYNSFGLFLLVFIPNISWKIWKISHIHHPQMREELLVAHDNIRLFPRTHMHLARRLPTKTDEK